MTTRVIFKAADLAERQPQEQTFTVDGVQYVDVLVEAAPNIPLVGRMDEPGLWSIEPKFTVPHEFGGWQVKSAPVTLDPEKAEAGQADPGTPQQPVGEQS